MAGLDPWTAAATAVVVVSLVAGSVGAWFEDSATPAPGAGVILLGLVGLLLAGRHSWLTAVIAAVLVAAEVRDMSPGGTWAVAGGLLFLVALRRQRLDAVVAGVAFAGAGVLADAPWARGALDGGVLGLITLAAAMVGVGQWIQAQRRFVAAEIGRRHEESIRRREEVARHVAEERLRIARDLHDSVAHHISVVSVQTNLARASLASSPDTADSALEAVQSASRSVLEELQVVLGVLRVEPAETDLPPDVSADRIRDLASSYGRIGLEVQSAGLQHLAELPARARAAVYRVLQEALTNAHRYGDGHARLALERVGDRQVELTVRNAVNPRAVPPAPAGGHGLVGMAERVSDLGGSLRAGPERGEFVVSVRLPATASAPLAGMRGPTVG